jgi:hypothetical protein
VKLVVAPLHDTVANGRKNAVTIAAKTVGECQRPDRFQFCRLHGHDATPVVLRRKPGLPGTSVRARPERFPARVRWRDEPRANRRRGHG